MADTVIGSILVNIKAKNEQLVNGLKQANTSVKTFGSNFAKDFGAIAAIGVATGFAVFKGLKSVVDAAADAETSQSLLANALRNAGDASEEALQGQLAYARSLQQTTAFGDDEIVKGQALLANYGLTGEALKAATRATLDLAVAKKMDMKAASDLVGKAFIGETSMLKRYGVVVDESVPKAKRFAVALTQLNESIGGAAEAERNTYVGQLKSFGNSWGDLKEELGMVFLPVFTKVAKTVTDFIENKLKPGIEVVKSAIKEFGGFGNTIKIVGMQMFNFNGILDKKIAKMQAAAIQAGLTAEAERLAEATKASAELEIKRQKDAQLLALQLSTSQSKIALQQDEADQMKEIMKEADVFTAEMQKVASEREKEMKAEQVKVETETKQALTNVASLSERAMTDIFSRELDARAKKKRLFQLVMSQLQSQITASFIASHARQKSVAVSSSAVETAAAKPAIAAGFFKAHAGIPFVGQAIALAFIAAAFSMIDRLVKFNKGGLVGGTGTSDTVPAMLTPGERVLSRDQTRAFDSGVAMGGGGKGTSVNLTVNIAGDFLEASPAKWRELFNDKILPEVRRFSMAQPTGPFQRRRGAL